MCWFLLWVWWFGCSSGVRRFSSTLRRRRSTCSTRPAQGCTYCCRGFWGWFRTRLQSASACPYAGRIWCGSSSSPWSNSRIWRSATRNPVWLRKSCFHCPGSSTGHSRIWTPGRRRATFGSPSRRTRPFCSASLHFHCLLLALSRLNRRPFVL